MCKKEYFCDICGGLLFVRTEDKDITYCSSVEKGGYLNKLYTITDDNKYLCMDCFRLSRFTDFENDELRKWDSDVRRPYYRLVGKPVTEEQALELITRTNFFWKCHLDESLLNENELNLKRMAASRPNFNTNELINSFPIRNSFVKPNGNVYTDGVTIKYPNVNELLEEYVWFATEFPYLDLVIAVSEWNEIPPAAWEKWCKDEDEDNDWEAWEAPQLWENFTSELSIVFHVCNGRVKVLTPQTGRILYQEYEDKYRDKNDMLFYNFYAYSNSILNCDEEFLKKLFDYCNIDNERAREYLQVIKNYHRRFDND